MISAVVYNPETNKVIKTVKVSNQESLDSNINEGEAYILSNWFGDISLASVINNEVVVEDSPDPLEAFLRAGRDKMLIESDWTQLSNSPLTDAKKQQWAIYRQQLRDLPSITTDFNNPPWPTPPE